MVWDVAQPEGNEQQLLEAAKRNGLDGLILLYPAPKRMGKPPSHPPLPFKRALWCESPQHAASLAKQADLLIAPADRCAVESKRIALLTRAEQLEQKDSLHYRRGGINQVHAELMAKRSATYLFDWSAILRGETPEQLLGRMMANERILRKYKVATMIATFTRTPEELRTRQELQAIMRVLERR